MVKSLSYKQVKRYLDKVLLGVRVPLVLPFLTEETIMTIDELIKKLETVKEKFDGSLEVHLQYQTSIGRDFGNEELRMIYVLLDTNKEKQWFVLLDTE